MASTRDQLAGVQSPSAATSGEQGLAGAGLLGGTGALLDPGAEAGRAFDVAAFDVATGARDGGCGRAADRSGARLLAGVAASVPLPAAGAGALAFAARSRSTPPASGGVGSGVASGSSPLMLPPPVRCGVVAGSDGSSVAGTVAGVEFSTAGAWFGREATGVGGSVAAKNSTKKTRPNSIRPIDAMTLPRGFAARSSGSSGGGGADTRGADLP